MQSSDFAVARPVVLPEPTESCGRAPVEQKPERSERVPPLQAAKRPCEHCRLPLHVGGRARGGLAKRLNARHESARGGHPAFHAVLVRACSSDYDEGASGLRATRRSHPMEPAFSLSASQRERVSARQFDPDALERLLQRHPPDTRLGLLRSFVGEEGDAGKASPSGVNTLPDVAVLASISDPELQGRLEDVWAPRWRGLSLEELQRKPADLPGIRMAILGAQRERGLR